MITPIKTISQIHNELLQKKQQIQKILQQSNILHNLPKHLDPQESHITIDKILQKIPDQQTLQHIASDIKSLQSQRIDERLLMYEGDYELVKKAIARKEELKPQAKIIYSIFSSLRLPRIKDEFKQLRQENKIKLKSLQISQDKNVKTLKFQRNSISEQHIFSLNQQTKTDEILHPIQYLKEGDMLIHVCIYDAVNRQKQHQYVFLGNMHLTELRNKIYCIAETLSKDQNSCVENSNNKQRQHKIIKEQCFFLFQQSLYYQGGHSTQQQMESLIQKIQSLHNKKFHKYAMSQTQLKNLRVVFGRPYIFRHMGGCDHMIVFKDLRLFQKQNNKNNYDPQIKKAYPIMTFESKMKRRKCQGCEYRYSIVACLGDKAKDCQTSYLCRQCHENLHNELSQDKNLLMKAIPYMHQ